MRKMFSIEMISEAKSPQSLNEDRFVISENVYGVFDGATGLDSFRNAKGETGGYLASSLAAETFSEFGITLGLEECALLANKRISDKMASAGIDLSKKEALWNTSASVIKLNKDNFEWIGIGDSPIIIIYTDNSYKVLCYYNHDKESLALAKNIANSKREQETESPYLRSEILPTIIKIRQEGNVKYGIINGEPSMVNFLESGSETLDKVKHILIFSDGLFIPSEDPMVDTFDKLVSIYLKGGLKEVLTHVREIENSDLSCSRYIRLKQHDDATGIAISIGC